MFINIDMCGCSYSCGEVGGDEETSLIVYHPQILAFKSYANELLKFSSFSTLTLKFMSLTQKNKKLQMVDCRRVKKKKI